MTAVDLRPWPPTDPGRNDRVTAARTVTAVVCAVFDAPSDESVLAVRRRVIELGVSLPARPPHRPHLTLAATRVVPDDLPEVVAAVGELGARHATMPLRLTNVGRFGRAGALWLGPALSQGPAPLRALQLAAAETVTDRDGWERAFGERSTSHGWVAHCTLATRLHPARLRDLQAALRGEYRPIDAVVAGLAVILVGGSGDVALAPLAGPPRGTGD